MKTLASTKPTRGGHKLAVQWDGYVVTAPPRRAAGASRATDSARAEREADIVCVENYTFKVIKENSLCLK